MVQASPPGRPGARTASLRTDRVATDRYQAPEMMILPSFRAPGIARGVGGAAARRTKTHTDGLTPADRSVIKAVGMIPAVIKPDLSPEGQALMVILAPPVCVSTSKDTHKGTREDRSSLSRQGMALRAERSSSPSGAFESWPCAQRLNLACSVNSSSFLVPL